MTLVLLVIVIQLIVISTNRTHSSISLRGREARLNTYLMVWLFEVLIADDPAAQKLISFDCCKQAFTLKTPVTEVNE